MRSTNRDCQVWRSTKSVAFRRRIHGKAWNFPTMNGNTHSQKGDGVPFPVFSVLIPKNSYGFHFIKFGGFQGTGSGWNLRVEKSRWNMTYSKMGCLHNQDVSVSMRLLFFPLLARFFRGGKMSIAQLPWIFRWFRCTGLNKKEYQRN